MLEHYPGFKSLTGTLVDVGGNRGVMLSKILAQNPNINGGVVFDLPHVLKQEGVVRQPNIRLIGGDMFKEVPKADAIFMKVSEPAELWPGEKECGAAAVPLQGKMQLAASQIPSFSLLVG